MERIRVLGWAGQLLKLVAFGRNWSGQEVGYFNGEIHKLHNSVFNNSVLIRKICLFIKGDKK